MKNTIIKACFLSAIIVTGFNASAEEKLQKYYQSAINYVLSNDYQVYYFYKPIFFTMANSRNIEETVIQSGFNYNEKDEKLVRILKNINPINIAKSKIEKHYIKNWFLCVLNDIQRICFAHTTDDSKSINSILSIKKGDHTIYMEIPWPMIKELKYYMNSILSKEINKIYYEVIKDIPENLREGVKL